MYLSAPLEKMPHSVAHIGGGDGGGVSGDGLDGGGVSGDGLDGGGGSGDGLASASAQERAHPEMNALHPVASGEMVAPLKVQVSAYSDAKSLYVFDGCVLAPHRLFSQHAPLAERAAELQLVVDSHNDSHVLCV